jgi:hypothetical protein
MALRHHRSMQPKDVWEGVEIVKAHPLLGPQYGGGVRDLRSVWLSQVEPVGARGFSRFRI